mmetsp:Transcript_43749/g.98515  ORF Transcript_43749/g.98515 Transcript_43749/m.98515 type:complete len:94 (-) Transcript_43749:6-287(-)
MSLANKLARQPMQELMALPQPSQSGGVEEDDRIAGVVTARPEVLDGQPQHTEGSDELGVDADGASLSDQVPAGGGAEEQDVAASEEQPADDAL